MSLSGEERLKQLQTLEQQLEVCTFKKVSWVQKDAKVNHTYLHLHARRRDAISGTWYGNNIYAWMLQRTQNLDQAFRIQCDAVCFEIYSRRIELYNITTCFLSIHPLCLLSATRAFICWSSD